MNERKETLAYLAGVIDSDGCINIQKRKAGKWAANYQPRVTVKQVTPQAVELLHGTLGGSTWLSAPSSQKGRPLYVWNIHSHAAGTALAALLPHLRIKVEQARNALALCEVNARLGRRRFPVPAVVDGEPMVTATEAAERVGVTQQSVYQAVRMGSVPSARVGRSVLIPESFLATWASRGTSPTRDPAITDELEALYLKGKVLNKVGV